MSQFNKQPKYSIRKFKVGVCSTVIAFSFLASGGLAFADEGGTTVNLETTEATRSSDTTEVTSNATSYGNTTTESVSSSNPVEERSTTSADALVESVETAVTSSSGTTVSESASTVETTTSSAIETEVRENTTASSSVGTTRVANSEQPSRASSDGLSGTVVEVAKESLAISGNSEVYQDGETPEKLIDGDPVTLTELKWDIDENRRLPGEIKLPQPVTFTFNNGEAVDLESLKIFKRINANGTLTKYRVTGFNGDDEVYSSGDIVTDFSEEIATHTLTQPTRVSRVQLTFLEAKNSAAGAVDNQKLSLKEVELYSNNGQKIDSSRFSVSGNEIVYETTYGAGLDKLTDGNLDTLAELKWDYGSNRKLPDTVSLPQDITLTTKDGSAIVLNKLEILKRAGSNGTLTKYRVQAFNGDQSVYRSEDVTTDFSEEVASHTLGNVTANKVIITFLEAKNTADGAVDKQKLTLREVKLYEFKAAETEAPAEQPVENPTETPAQPNSSETEDAYVKPVNALGAISSLTFENDRATIHFATGQKAQLDLYNNHVFRYNIENGDARFVDTPEPSRADRPAEIAIKKLADYKKDGNTLGRLSQDDKTYTIETDAIKLVFDKASARMSVYDQAGKLITKEVVPVQMTAGSATQTLSQAADEYFFGGGMQNGRFTHKGNKISIVNENNWVDGGVASPNPFYWSTRGYGVLRNTFKPGSYDFGTTNKAEVETTHNESRFDAYFFINTTPANIIKDYQELTGTPVVLPEYALYLGHLNAYNRDYWVEVPEGTRGAIKLDGKYYREYQPNQLPEADRAKAVKETLNGEGDSYTFSARAVIDRYKNMDMPVAWFLPNDGYGAGYGQADSLEGNIQNLKKFVEYAKQNGIKVGLWTQSDLYDTDPSKAVVLHRNIEKEVADAGIRAIKTDVAWVGPGYSFGLNGVTTGATLLTEKSGENARPFIISLDGWGGTQRGAAIWSGDQVGGEWEYIRFHIPTYIGLGLSGNPNMGSDMDGIFGGGNAIINAREYQWKMFTSIMMNMDGWGANPKTPFAFDDKTTDLNRISLKTKSTLTPYAYSTGHQAAETGKPIVRAMFLDYPSDAINYTKAVQYQYMYGDYFLVAPIYEETAMDSEGNDIRNNIYLPEGVEWIDFYTGEKYEGGRVLNGFDAPLWKIPVFVKNGAIIPMANANNNPTEIDRSNRLVQFYPHKSSEFKLYEDDGTSEGYKTGEVATTLITSQAGDSNTKGTAVLTFGKTSGDFTGFVKEKTTELHVNVSEDVDSVTARIGDRDVTLTRVNSLEDYEKGTNVFFYHKDPTMATYGARSEAIQNLTVTMNDLVKIKLEKTDVTQSETVVTINGFINKKADKDVDENLAIPAVPTDLATPVAYVTATDIKVTWTASEGADAYDLRHNGIIYSNIKATEFSFGDLDYGSSHTFEVRAVNAKGSSDWSAPLTTQTSQDPWLNAIDIDPAKVETNIRQQPGEGIDKLFNKKKGDMFHSDWNSSVSSDSYIKVDLGGVYDLDYLEYRQRSDGGLNGRVQWTNFWTSEDGVNWTPSGGEDWRGDGISKKHVLNAKARYVYMAVTSSYNGFISGEEMLIFKKPGTKMAVPGDINNDGKITEDDKTSFLNYTGLRKSDSDFDYIKHVDVNGNGLIDAQDINVIATQLEGGVTNPQTVSPSGRLYLTADKLTLKAGETALVTLMADEVANTNALTSTFKIDAGALSVVGNQVTPNADFTKEAENFSNVKTREGKTDVVFTFVNFGDKPLLSGSGAVATVTLKALTDVTLDFSSNEGILVGNNQAATKVTNEPVRQAVHYTGPATTPTNVTVTRPTQGSLTLTWENDAQALRYVVEKEVTAEDGSKSYVEVARVETNSADIYNLLPDTAYNFRVKAVNPLGTSEATELISGRTTVKDVAGRVTGITATAEVASQTGQEVALLVDGSEDTQYHSEWYNTRAVPSSVVLDLGASKELDHLVYVPRRDAGNGTITSLTLQVSEDGQTWSAATPVIKWDRNNTDKVALLPAGSQGRYVKVNWLSSVGGFASGQELYVLTKASEVTPNPDPSPTQTPVPEKPDPNTVVIPVENGTVSLENGSIARHFEIQDGKLRTVAIENKIAQGGERLEFDATSKEFIIQFKETDTTGRPVAPGYQPYAKDKSQWILSTNSAANASDREGRVELSLDNNLNTIWHSNYHAGGTGTPNVLPAYVDITFPESKVINTFVYIPRQDGAQNGLIKDYKVYLKQGDETEFREVKAGTITENPSKLQFIDLGEQFKNVTSLRFEALNAQNGQPFAAASEFDISEKTAAELLDEQVKAAEKYAADIESYLNNYQVSLDKLTLAENGISRKTTDEGETLTFTFKPFTYNQVPVTVKYVVDLQKDSKFTQAHLLISVPEGDRDKLTIDTIDLQSFKLTSTDKIHDFSNQDNIAEMAGFNGFYAGLGQPVYIKSFYTGSEFPIALNKVDMSNSLLLSRYYSGKTLSQIGVDDKGNVRTWNTVFGVARSDDYQVIQQDFYDYIATIGQDTYFRKQYNSWFDHMLDINAENIKSSFSEIERGFASGGVSPLDSYVVDDGWQDMTTLWNFNSKFPNKLYDSSKQVKRFGSDFGLWLGPQGGYSQPWNLADSLAAQNLGSKHAYAVYIGDKRYTEGLNKLFTNYEHEFDINYWKLDGLLLNPRSDTDPNGNFIGGGYMNMYSMTESHERWIKLYETIRSQATDPDKMWINLTSYIPPSPWFLQWVNSIWMQNSADVDYEDNVKKAEYAHLDFGNDANEAITYRDDRYEELVKVRKWQIPFANIYNHDPVYGNTANSAKRLEPGGDYRPKINFSTEDLRTYLYMLGTRGTGFWEFYYSYNMMDADKWQVNGEVVNWIESNYDTLKHAKFHGGKPGHGEVYGYSAWDEEKGILSIRNPIDAEQDYIITLDRLVGVREGTVNMHRTTVHGDKRHDTREVMNYGDSLTISLKPYETVIFQFSKDADTKAPEILVAKAISDKQLTLEFDERILTSDATFTVDNHRVTAVALNADLRTVTLTLEEALKDREAVQVTYQEVADNAATPNKANGSVTVTAYANGIIEDITTVDPTTPLVKEGVEGKGTFSVTARVTLDKLDQTLAEQEGQWKLSVDETGRVVFAVKDLQVTSAPFDNLKSDDKGTPDKLLTTGQDVVITAVREKNGSLKLYIDGELHNTAYDKAKVNEALTKSTLHVGTPEFAGLFTRFILENQARDFESAVTLFETVSPRDKEVPATITGADATSYDPNDGGERPAGSAIDHNNATYWASNPDKDNVTEKQQLTLTLDKVQEISRVLYTPRQIANAVGNIKKGYLEYSTDGVDFKRVTFTNGNVDQTITMADGIATTSMEFTPVEAKYIRLTALETHHWSPSAVNKVVAVAELTPLITVHPSTEVPVTVAYLRNALDQVEELNLADYDEQSVKALTTAIEEAKTALDSRANQSSVDSANATVKEALKNLVKKAEQPAVVEVWTDELYPIADDSTVVEDWSEDIAPEVLEATQVITLTDQATGVSVHLTAKPSEVAGLRLEVIPSTVTQVAPILDDNLETQDLDIYDIHFVNASGEVVTVEGSRQVILPKRANRDIEAVYYVNPTQEDESLDYTVLSDTTVSVTVDHFSLYTVVYRTKPIEAVKESVDFIETDYTSGKDIITDAVSYDDYELRVIVDGQTVQTSHFKNITYDTLLAGLSALTESKLSEGLSYDSTRYDGQVVTMIFSSGVTSDWVDELYPEPTSGEVSSEWVDELYPEPISGEVSSEWVDDAYVSSNAEEATVDTKKVITEGSGEDVVKLETGTQSKSGTSPAATEVSSQKAKADEKGTFPQTGDVSNFAYVAFGVASLLSATAIGKRRRN